MEQVRWIGYHGTSVSSARSICAGSYDLTDKKAWFGRGVYFFQDWPPHCDGRRNARSWAQNVRKCRPWAVVKTNLSAPEKRVLDLLGSPEACDLFVVTRDKLLAKHKQTGNSRETFTDRVVYTALVREFDFHLIRAMVDSDRRRRKVPQGMSVEQVTVTLLQVFVYAAKMACIGSSEICETES